MARSTFIALLLAFSATASADGFDYNFLSLGYGNIEFDEVGVDGDGFVLSGSYSLNDSYFVFANYDAADLDFSVDATTWGVGFGYRRPVSDKADFYARASYEYIEIDVPLVGSADDNGLGLGVGLRYSSNPDFEWHAGINYVDYGDGGDDTGLEVGGLYSFTEKFSLGLSGEWSDDISRYTIAGRFYFGR